MSQINELTDAQKEQLSVYRDKWIKIGLSTDPANREEAEKAIKLSYQLAGLKEPEKIIWSESPFAQGIIRGLYLNNDDIKKSVDPSIYDSIFSPKWISFSCQIWDSIKNSIPKEIKDSIISSARDSVNASGYGQHDAGFLSFYEYFREVLNLKEQTEKITGLIGISKNAGWYIPHEKVCFICERHSIVNRNDSGRLHSLTGPAVMYPDGWAVYSVNGVRVPEYVIKNPETITIKKIEKEENAEIRRVMIDQYDREFKGRYINDSGAKIISKDTDKFGRERILYLKEIPDDEPMVMVKVINSTPEPDGKHKEYYLRVPPNMQTPEEAVAWTFGKEKDEYSPSMET